MAGRGERVHPAYYDPEISEPVSPTATERSTATGYSFHPNYQPLKAYTTPGYESPSRPPPTEIGRPPIRPPQPLVKPLKSRNSKSNGRKCCRRCLLTCCIFLVLLVFLLGLAALIIWIVFKPQIPQYSVQDVRINKMNVTATYDTASASLQPTNPTFVDTDIVFTLHAKNPNKKIRIDYRRVNIQTTYQGANVGKATIPGWYQEVQNTTVVKSDILATKAPLTVTQGSSLLVSIKANDVPLHARIDTRVAIKMGAWLTPAVWIHVNCNFQVAPPSAPGGAKLLSKSCKWKWKP